MAELFSDEWMKSYQQQWNSDSELTDALAKIGFSSIIAYGIDGDDDPRGYIEVVDGQAVSAGAYTDQTLNWDLRSSQDAWEKWMKKPPGMMGLGAAYASRKLKFKVGDYSAMIKDPRMAAPFIKTFSVMGKA